MVDQPKGKGLLDQALNLVTNRDERAALEEAKQYVEELEQKVEGLTRRADIAERRIVELENALSKAKAENQATQAKLQSEAQAAKAYITQLEQRVAAAEAKAKLYDDEKLHAQMEVASQAAEAARILEMHTMTDKETLSDLSLKYYGHATKPYWTIIYEANKDAIGSNPNKVRPGTVLKIPVLPPDMKK